ncbi:hypothetical protein LRAMOSA02453 [Lichtheimia ramosa]|uniref:CAF1B/HIR1 beta-propeller domain-containing protein n=1 Tax=Lichtheimia ramosa TaxID=688394 RepID=A0A077WQB7_9FUNG|nr:hypothetical protein LRAMOSA02453 [Lichtheimia ramosa]
MKAKTIEINWHDGLAIYSVDYSSDGIRFASAGADTSVRLWSIKRRADNTKDNSQNKTGLPVHIEFLSELKRHSGPVNVVRFSPSGEYLASAGDDSCVIIWKRSMVGESAFGRDNAEFEKESWSVVHMFHGHNKEIYDLAWSPCGEYIITASIDNTARVWSISARSTIHVFTDHTHYVQGVAWDPLGEYVATQSSDRSVAVYHYKQDSQRRLHFGAAKRHYKMTKTADSTSTRFYHDENLVTFFRRLSFSPDGTFLITPAGVMTAGTEDGDNNVMHCAFIYPRNTIRKHPIAHTSNHNKPTIAVRWSRHAYQLRSSNKSRLFTLPHRLLYAVASQEAIYIYDTQQSKPLCVVSGMHFAPITDVSWSHDGTMLAFSSADGYCSTIVFDEEELGVIGKLPARESITMTPSIDNDISYEQQHATEKDVVMMDISSPPQPIRVEKRAAIATVTPQSDKTKKRRIAPTLISSSLPSSTISPCSSSRIFPNETQNQG